MATVSAVAPVLPLKNILFPTDFSDCSRQELPCVAALARRFGATIHLCHFVTPSELVLGAPEAAPERYEAEHRTMEKALQELRFLPEMRGLCVNTILTSGILREELTKEINKNHIDLLVVSTHGRSGLRRLALGSVADVICRSAPCPVLTIGPCASASENVQFRRILVPTDLSRHSTVVLPFVMRIAQEYQASIAFLHVLQPNRTVDAKARRLAEDAGRILRKLFGKACVDHTPEFLIKFGQTAEAILGAAAENKCDLIAMGINPALMPEVHLRSGVAYQVMARAHCAVLTCRST